MTDLDFFDTGLWDLTACCRFYQTGACEHTEAQYDDLDAEPIPDACRWTAPDPTNPEPF
jgi:hypothetical protein